MQRRRGGGVEASRGPTYIRIPKQPSTRGKGRLLPAWKLERLLDPSSHWSLPCPWWADLSLGQGEETNGEELTSSILSNKVGTLSIY